GQSLLMSVLLRPSIPTAHAPQISLVAGLAVAGALEPAAGVSARIRWPNDVLIGGRKVCGVLPEAVSSADGRVGHLLLGIGINVDESETPEGREGLAVDVDDDGALLVDAGEGTLTRLVAGTRVLAP